MRRTAKICFLGVMLAIACDQTRGAPQFANHMIIPGHPRVGTFDVSPNLASGSNVLDATSFAGADFGARVNSCLLAVEQAGGGVCDARGFGATNSSSENITVGDGAHGVTLLLPAGTISFASGSNLIYRSMAVVIGEGPFGTTISCDSGAGSPCVTNYNESGNNYGGLVGARLEHFGIQGTGSTAAASSGLMVGGNGSNVFHSHFEDLLIRGFDIATSVDGPGGCTCYNSFENITSMGQSFGIKIINSSSWPGGANSNTWYGGLAWGNVGLYASGDGKNRFYGIDIEGSAGHGIDLEGYGDTVISPYEESDGADLINGAYNFVIGPMAYGGGHYSPESICATCLVFGPDASMTNLGVRDGIIFGSPNNFNDGANSQVGFTLVPADGVSPPSLTLNITGNLTSQNGNFGEGLSGNAPLEVGKLTATGGASILGAVHIGGVGIPPAPTAAVVGLPGNTTQSYAVVCRDYNGGLTLPSTFTTITNAPNVLNSSNYVTITPPAKNGCFKWDILKGDTDHALAVNVWGDSHTDNGQATSAYTPTTRDTTGDTRVSGQLVVAGYGLKLATSSAIPACDSSLGGTQWFVPGTQGTQDGLYLCAKDSTGKYGWRSLLSLSPSAVGLGQ